MRLMRSPCCLCVCVLMGKLLLALASTVILSSESHGTHDHILLYYDFGNCEATLWLCVGRSGKLLLAFASNAILGSESHGTHDHILLSHDSGSRTSTGTAVSVCWRVNCCWPSPAQSFLVPSPAGLRTIFYSLTALGAFRTHSPCLFVRVVFYLFNFRANLKENAASNSWTRRFLCGPFCIKGK
jgi:hypothetical protein